MLVVATFLGSLAWSFAARFRRIGTIYKRFRSPGGRKPVLLQSLQSRPPPDGHFTKRTMTLNNWCKLRPRLRLLRGQAGDEAFEGTDVLCERCHGKGVTQTASTCGTVRAPCPECGGCGILHCCEGLIEQPSPPPHQVSAGRSDRGGDGSPDQPRP